MRSSKCHPRTHPELTDIEDDPESYWFQLVMIPSISHSLSVSLSLAYIDTERVVANQIPKP